MVLKNVLKNEENEENQYKTKKAPLWEGPNKGCTGTACADDVIIKKGKLKPG